MYRLEKAAAMIEQEVRDSAYHIINSKGSTYFAVDLALVKHYCIDPQRKNSVLTVPAMLSGEFGINDVCLSVPCVLSDKGVTRIITSPLTSTELDSLSRSAAVLKEAIVSLSGDF